MGIWRSLLRRLGYVRLRDYNLRATKNGMLVPISSDRPVPIDLTHPALMAPPARPHTWPPPPPLELAEGTCDGLEPATSRPPSPPPAFIEARTQRLYSEPLPAPEPYGSIDDDDELPYQPWTEEELE